MANYRSILIAICMVMLAGCGTSGDEPETATPKDARTGNTFKTNNEMLEAVKAQRPFEYEVVFGITKDNPQAMDSYMKYNADTRDDFPKPVFMDISGKEVSRENFDEELKSKKLGQDFEDVIPQYFQNIEHDFYDRSFAIIEPNSNFQALMGSTQAAFEGTARNGKNISRVTDVLPIHYKLVDQGGLVLLEVAFKTTAFWAPVVLDSPPEEIQKEVEKGKPADLEKFQKNNTPDMSKAPSDPSKKPAPVEWSYHMSGLVRFRLIYKDGTWLIHDQI